jgi:hypothetical protein
LSKSLARAPLNAGKFLLIDRKRLETSMEAWVNVIINYEQIDNSLLKGFGEIEGILTWNNSD